MPTDSPRSPDAPSHRRHPALRLAAKTALWGGGLVAALFLLFLLGLRFPADFLRDDLERVLSRAFGMPTRIEGPMHLRTGWVARIEADALTLTDAQGALAKPFARAARPSVRIDLFALLRNTVHLEELAIDQLTLDLKLEDGRGNWTRLFPANGAGSATFAGIDHLHIHRIDATYLGAQRGEPKRVRIERFAAALLRDRPITARGTTSLAGQSLDFGLTAPPLAQLVSPQAQMPLGLELSLGRARMKFDGSVLHASNAYEGSIALATEDADSLFGAFGLATHAAGKLTAQARIRGDGGMVELREMTVQLGKSDAAGQVGVNWSGERPKLMFDVSAQRIDPRPFIPAPDPARSESALERFVDGLDHVVATMDIEGKALVADQPYLPPPLRRLDFAAHAADRRLHVDVQTDLWNMSVTGGFDFDATQARRTLAARLRSARVSTQGVPETLLPGAVTLNAGDFRGDFQGAGATPKEISASLRGRLDARNLRVAWQQAQDRRMEAKFGSASLELGGGKPVVATASGGFSGQPCALKLSGGTFSSLLQHERWPVRFEARCPASLLTTQAQLTRQGPVLAAEGAFKLRADSVRPLLAMLGTSSAATLPAAGSGQFRLDQYAVRVKLDQASLGRSSGSGEVLWHLDGKDARHELRLALATADADELLSVMPRSPQQQTTKFLALEILPAKLALPNLDLHVSADTVRVGGTTLRKLAIDAAPRGGQLPPARLAFVWNGAPVSGALSADFRAAKPGISVDIAGENIDFSPLLAQIGREQAAMRAGKVHLRASSSGSRVDELLAHATVVASLAAGEVGQMQHLVPGMTGKASYSANLNVAADQPVMLAIQARTAGDTLALSLRAGRLSELARAEGTIPATLLANIGKTRIEATGRFASDGRSEARIKLTAERLDHLGQMLGVELPAIGPYAADYKLAVSPDAIQATDIDARIGKTRVLGSVGISNRKTRPSYSANLQAPILRIEDLRPRPSGAPPEADKPSMRRLSDWLSIERRERYLNTLRSFDAKATLDVGALYLGEVPARKLALAMTLSNGKLGLNLRSLQQGASQASLDVQLLGDGPKPQLQLRVNATDFEFGEIAHALRSDSATTGKLDATLDLTTQLMSVPLFSDARGRSEFAIYPRELRVEGIQFWGVSVLGVIRNTLDPGSNSSVNCGVFIWNVQDGIARTEAFFADTTHTRIIGEIQIDLRTGELSGRLTPRAKNPALFRVNPSVALSGTIDAPKTGVAPQSLITTPLRLVAPLQLFAYDWLTRTPAGGDSASACREAFQKAREAKR